MSIIVDLYEIFVERGTAKEKARGAAGAAHLNQHLVTKEDLLAKRLIEQQLRLTAPPARKDPGPCVREERCTTLPRRIINPFA